MSPCRQRFECCNFLFKLFPIYFFGGNQCCIVGRCIEYFIEKFGFNVLFFDEALCKFLVREARLRAHVLEAHTKHVQGCRNGFGRRGKELAENECRQMPLPFRERIAFLSP